MRVGLTGGIASGKSTVSAILRELGAVVIDADRVAREVVARGTSGLTAVVEEFGPGILTEEGEMDRAAVAAIVFGDEGARRRLEGIIHPLVHQEVARLEEQAPPEALVVHDIPLLAESGRAGTFDAVVVVDASEESQVTRMVRERGWTEDEARARMGAQSSRADRLAIATHVLDNNGTVEELRRQVEELYATLAPPGHGWGQR
jgi:dephospho-CoA kinase